MRELSLFSGAGGGLLGTMLLGWEPVGYVEYNEKRCKVLDQRIRDGYLADAPVWNLDIREFNARIAPLYRGVADVVTAGFPCQPFSVAGRRRGADDDRNMWPATAECLRLVRPRYAFLENVPGLLASGYFGRILGDLAESGFDVRWRCLSAAELGAPHRRVRLWIVAHDSRTGTGLEEHRGRGQRRKPANPLEPEVLRQGERKAGAKGTDPSRPDVADAECEVRTRQRNATRWGGRPDSSGGAWWSTDPADLPDAEGSRRKTCGTNGMGNREPERELSSAHGGSWPVESRVGRVADGVARRVDRLGALGDGQVPAVVARVWKLLSEGIND